MKKFLGVSVLSFAFLLTACSNQNANVADPNVNMNVRNVSMDNSSTIQMLDEVRCAVVGISVDLSDGYSVGSGVAINNGNYILTNNHVVENGRNITLYFADKTTGSAKLIWANESLDLAILKSSREIPFLSSITENQVDIGEDIYAIGTPLTLQFKHTVTKGIVSAKDRVLEVDGNSGTYFQQSLIQHDASINPGNSGGPLINSEGKVVGINTLKASEGEGIGFAIPIRVGNAILNRIVENEDYKCPYLGIFGFDSEIAEVYGEQVDSLGVYIVSTSGVSKQVGLKKGDIITKLDDTIINKMLDLRVALFNYSVTDKVNITFIRDGVERQIEVGLS